MTHQAIAKVCSSPRAVDANVTVDVHHEVIDITRGRDTSANAEPDVVARYEIAVTMRLFVRVRSRGMPESSPVAASPGSVARFELSPGS